MKKVLIHIFVLIPMLIFANQPDNALAEGVVVSPSCILSWTPSTGAVEGYKVYAGSTSGGQVVKATVSATTVACSALSLATGQQYAHVVAFNVVGDSVPGDTIPFVLTSAPPGKPGALVVR